MLMISSRLVDSNSFIIVIRLELSSILSADGTSVKIIFRRDRLTKRDIRFRAFLGPAVFAHFSLYPDNLVQYRRYENVK